MPKSVLPRARAPPPLDKREARARARGSTIFETFNAQNAEICAPPRPCPRRLDPMQRPKHGHAGVRISKLSGLKMPKSVLPRARAPPAPGQKRGQSTGTGFRDFQGSMLKSVLPRARAPPPPGPQRPKHGHVGVRSFQGSKCRNLYSPAPVPPRSWTKERPEHGRGGVRISRRKGLKMPKSVLPRARGPPRPGSTIFETFNAQNAKICTPPARASTNFETFRAQNAEICTPPRPCPPPLGKREARARARGSTIFETFRAQNAEICTPPRPCPPPPGPQRPKHGEYEAFKSQNAEICTPPHPCPPAPGQKRGQSTGAGEYEFRDFHFSKCRNLYSPAPVATRPWTKERPEHGRGGVRFSRLSTLKMPKSVLPRARAPRRPQRPKHGHVGVRTHGPHASLEKLSHHVIHIYAGATARPSGNTGATRP